MDEDIPSPDDELAGLLHVLVWDHGDIPFDLKRDLEVVVVRAVSAANPLLLDRLLSWLGRDRLLSLLDRVAEQVSWLGMTMAVYRYDLPPRLIDRADRHALDWLGAEVEHAGLAFLQAGWQAG